MPSPTAANTKADGPPTANLPQTPLGWIAQWDDKSGKYYFVQLRTGQSQWEMPTEMADSNTPFANAPHPFGKPPVTPELIVHPDGSQTIRHADGQLDPILSPEARALSGVDESAAPVDRGLGQADRGGGLAVRVRLGGERDGDVGDDWACS